MGSSTPSQKEIYEAHDAALTEIRKNIKLLLEEHNDVSNIVYRDYLASRCMAVAKAAEALGGVYGYIYD